MNWGVLGVLLFLATLLQSTSGDVRKELQSSGFVHRNPTDIIPEMDQYPQNEYPFNKPTKIYETVKENGQEGKNVISSILDKIRNGTVFKTVKSVVPYGLQTDGLNGIIDFRSILANDGKHIIKPREIVTIPTVVYENTTDAIPVKNLSKSSNDILSKPGEKPNNSLPHKNNETIMISDIIISKLISKTGHQNVSHQRQLNPDPNQLEIQNKKAVQEILQFSEPLNFKSSKFQVSPSKKTIGSPKILREQNETSKLSFPRFRIIPGIPKPKAKNAFTYKESKEDRNAVFDESTLEGDNSEIPGNNETIKLINNFKNSNGTSKNTQFDHTEAQNKSNIHEPREKILCYILDYLLDMFVDKKVKTQNKDINIVLKFEISYDSNNLNKKLDIKDLNNENDDYDEDDINPNQNSRRKNYENKKSYNDASINIKSSDEQDRANSNKTNIMINNKQNNIIRSGIKNIMNSILTGKNYLRGTNKINLKVNKQNKSEGYLNKSEDTVLNANSEIYENISKWVESVLNSTNNTYEQNTSTERIPETVENSKKMKEKTNESVIRTILHTIFGYKSLFKKNETEGSIGKQENENEINKDNVEIKASDIDTAQHATQTKRREKLNVDNLTNEDNLSTGISVSENDFDDKTSEKEKIDEENDLKVYNPYQVEINNTGGQLKITQQNVQYSNELNQKREKQKTYSAKISFIYENEIGRPNRLEYNNLVKLYNESTPHGEKNVRKILLSAEVLS